LLQLQLLRAIVCEVYDTAVAYLDGLTKRQCHSTASAKWEEYCEVILFKMFQEPEHTKRACLLDPHLCSLASCSKAWQRGPGNSESTLNDKFDDEFVVVESADPYRCAAS